MTKQLIKVVCFWQLAWRSIYVFPLSRKWSRVVLLIVTILLISEGISDSFSDFSCNLPLQVIIARKFEYKRKPSD